MITVVASNNVSLSLGVVVFQANATAAGLVVGAYYQISLAGSAPHSEYMQGVMTSLNATTITVNVTTVTGTPAVVGNAWNFAVLSPSSSSRFSSSSSSSSSSPSTFYGAQCNDQTAIAVGINTWNVTNTSGLNTGDYIQISSMWFTCGATYGNCPTYGPWTCRGYVLDIDSPQQVTLNLTTCTVNFYPSAFSCMPLGPWWISLVSQQSSLFHASGAGIVVAALGLQTFNVSEFYDSFGETGYYASHGSYYGFEYLQINSGVQISLISGGGAYMQGVVVDIDFPLFTLNVTRNQGVNPRWQMQLLPC